MKGFQVAIITLTAGTFTPGWAAENARGSSVPDLSGFYDSGTRTPEQRPAAFGDRQFLTEAEAEELLKQATFLQTDENVISDPNRGAPVKGGDGNNAFGAGAVGGYNSFWVDPGSGLSSVDGKFRTSIIYDPPNGRRPSMTPRGMRKIAENFTSFSYTNDGTASWLENEGPGPFDLSLIHI